MLKNLIDALMCKRRKSPPRTGAPRKRVKIEYECPICKGIYASMWKTECGHRFCAKCIEIQLNYTQTCPICREDLAGSLLGPSRSTFGFEKKFIRVSNGIKCPYQGLEIDVRDKQGVWQEGLIKLVIPNGDKFPLLLIAHSGIIETIPQDSMRIKQKKVDKKDEIKALHN